MPAFNNHLINETSPYLLQHAHNPVNWYPWGDEALQKAKEEDKPILVSIGYSACHWCHVMEKESFEDEITANLMNDLFINIKIDREERPDLDHIYMDAVQAIAGNGGWPLNVFLTPDRKPFYGGTYFPPVKAFNRSSWKEVLSGVSNLFKEKRTEVEVQAEELTNHIGKSTALVQMKKLFNEENRFTRQQLDTAFKNIMKQADKKWGGFGQAPKFPQTFTISYLLRYYHFSGNIQALDQACLSIDKMIAGGIYDHVGGGFARYATDEEWLAPHFEKMLYDNALIISTLSEAFQLTKNQKYSEVVKQTVDFIKRELMNEQGGFYAALDADSEGEEGKFYVWNYDGVTEILGDNAALFCEYYNISPEGNWEHKNILRTLKSLTEFAIEKNLDKTELQNFFNDCCNKLLKQRNTRVRPALDDKIILGWNALMIIALCKASSAFSNSDYKELAITNINFLWQNLKLSKEGNSFHHTYKNGVSKYPAFLDDYAYLISACIHLQEITSDTVYLERAKNLTEYVIENFICDKDQQFFYTGKQQKDVIIRKKEIYDGAVPSGNSVMCANLFYLSVIFNINEWKLFADSNLKNLAELAIKYPTSFGNWCSELATQVCGINEIVIAGPRHASIRDELLVYFIPNKVFQCTLAENDSYPLLKDKKILDQTLIYLCKEYSCRQPVSTVNEVMIQLL